jgi:hypothetical protein
MVETCIVFSQRNDPGRADGSGGCRIQDQVTGENRDMLESGHFARPFSSFIVPALASCSIAQFEVGVEWTKTIYQKKNGSG